MALSDARRIQFKQVGKFGAAGLLNTFIDFFIFNFCSKFLKLALLPSNTISTTIAMVVSFLVNRNVVFKDGDHSRVRQAVTFYAVTAFGLYVIQNGIIHVFAVTWTQPLMAVIHVLRNLGISLFSDAFYVNNGAKAIGTVASLTWNFIMYKRIVFK